MVIVAEGCNVGTVTIGTAVGRRGGSGVGVRLGVKVLVGVGGLGVGVGKGEGVNVTVHVGGATRVARKVTDAARGVLDG